MEINSEEDWALIIQPKRGVFDLRLGELWQARDLIKLFIHRDFVAMYKQTILGPLWYIIQPLLTTITFTVIFGQIAQLPTDGLPDFIFYMSGTIIWSYFAACLTGTSNTFSANANLFGKVYFPRLAVPFAKVISQLINFGIQFLFFLGFLLYFILSGADITPNISVLLLPFLLILLALQGLGIGVLISSLTTKYRDLQKLISFGVQLFMYATPIIYPVSSIPDNYQMLIQANPLTAVIEAFRFSFLGAGTLSWSGLAYSSGVTIVLLAISIVLFNRIETTFMDTV